MSPIPRLLHGLCLSSLLVLSLQLSGAESRLPAEHFFAEDDLRQVQLAPGGRHLAFLTTLATKAGGQRVGIALMHLDSGRIEPLVSLNDESIKFFLWKGDDHVVFGGDLGGNESLALRSISLSRRRVVSLAESYREFVSDRANQAVLLSELRADPAHILIYGNKDVGSYTWGIWRLNIRTGQRLPVEPAGGNEDFQQRLADQRGHILARSRYTADRIVFEVRADLRAPFIPVAEFPANDPRWELLQFAADNETLYFLASDYTDTAALHALNVRTRERSAPLLVPTGGEITGLIQSYDRSRLLGAAYFTDRPHLHWFDDARARLQQQIDASLPHTVNRVTSTSADEQLLVIHAASDRDPGTYYLLDRRIPRLMPIGRVNRHLDSDRLRPMEPVSFPARDGLVLHGYLTRPATDSPTPLIVLPHGGPFGVRDCWGFNAEVQFLANRGYAVLQVNYRGSGGYGQAFLEAGRREWGGRMQDDLSDGVRWAIAQGHADPARIGIYGASYGGYAALAGAVFTPELYRCAVNYVGVTDLALITSWSRRFGDRGGEIFFREWVGDDKAYLHARSPINFIDRLRIPTLHAYGANDPRVDLRHWQRLEPKLKQHQAPYEAIIEEREGHGFFNEASRLAFYRRLEAFLDRHLMPLP